MRLAGFFAPRWALKRAAYLAKSDAVVEEAQAAPRPTLAEQLDAIETPAEIYRIGEDIQTGFWWVEGWSKTIYRPTYLGGYYYPSGSVISGYNRLASLLPSRERAELWLAAYISPEKHRTAYGAEGNRLEPAQ